MILIPNEVFNRYIVFLTARGIADSFHEYFKKWLRYYLDFCDKYPVPDDTAERVRLFCEKLRDKGQSKAYQEQAAFAVSLYYEMIRQEDSVPSRRNPEQSEKTLEKASGAITNDSSASYQADDVQPKETQHLSTKRSLSHYTEAGYQEKSKSPEWDEVLAAMTDEIKVHHYSRKTLKTYANWSRNFQRFLRDKPPRDLTDEDVKEYLTYLAVKCQVASSTQNQAFNSLLFFYRYGLKREFGELRDVPRAKKSLYIPAVLSREEIDAILKHLSYPHNLVVKMLFGCGLRLFEGLQLRVRDFNFEAGMLTVHGKGKKDRTVPLPESIISELKLITSFATPSPPTCYRPAMTSA